MNEGDRRALTLDERLLRLEATVTFLLGFVAESRRPLDKKTAKMLLREFEIAAALF
jgi:hypothetical protein